MVYILSGRRTPGGSFLGGLSQVSAPHLGALAINGALEKSNVEKNRIDEVFMGHVLQAGQGQAPARQAAIFAGLPPSVPCTTINKVCGSGMKSIILGAQTIKVKDNRLVVAGGMENMSMAPYLLTNLRKGRKIGDDTLYDSLQLDGLLDVYTNRSMGSCAEECVKRYKFSRQEQDAFATESFKRAQKALRDGVFQEEIIPVTVKRKKREFLVANDEGPALVKFDKIAHLRPTFEKEGTITPANASTLNDGAAALVLGGEEHRDNAEFRIISYGSSAGDPTWFTTAPVSAMKKSLEIAGLALKDIELFEINEAFAVVAMATMKELNLSTDNVNIYGGAIALGHPLGCSGARIVITLMTAMKRKKVRYGMASVCIGGGEALALIVERIG